MPGKAGSDLAPGTEIDSGQRYEPARDLEDGQPPSKKQHVPDKRQQGLEKKNQADARCGHPAEARGNKNPANHLGHYAVGGQ